MAIIKSQKSALEMAIRPSYEKFINNKWIVGDMEDKKGTKKWFGPQAVSQSENLTMLVSMSPRAPYAQRGPNMINKMRFDGSSREGVPRRRPSP